MKVEFEQGRFVIFEKLAKAEAELLTTSEVIGILKVSRPTLSRWQKSGYLVPIKTGGRCRYRQSDIDAIQRK